MELMEIAGIVLGSLAVLLVALRQILKKFKDKTESKLDDQAFNIMGKIVNFLEMIGFKAKKEDEKKED